MLEGTTHTGPPKEEATPRDIVYSSEQIRDQKILQHDTCHGADDFFFSNEGNIRVYFKYLKGLRNGIVGVGSDQVLDLMAGTDLTSAILVDYAPLNHLTIRTLLEIGTMHRKTCGEYPTPEQFVPYFCPENREALARMMERIYSPAEIDRAMGVFGKGIPLFGKAVPYSEYMQARMSIKDEDGTSAAWYGTAAKLTKVLEGYGKNRVALSLSDLTKKDQVIDVVNYAREKGLLMDVVYLSDLEQYVENAAIWRNLDMMPREEDFRILKTEIDIQCPLGDVCENPILRHLTLPYRYIMALYADRRAVSNLTPGYALAPTPQEILNILIKR